ncbi:uncharacterized protein B0P05DRAFT_564475 [Gilbertella persicaria]|uniref:uncharacterized protein n=1 Tax=Gilbertella persicaria TaxID=101096 RepID=UPI00221F0A5D|nr:uncharacterized protein B0P05DRAFT_564475 [Gilbertella persicaria]KAI8048326.1 hypothetical protein B0P05DRAFT_564475 [Gilbertella persicaria]
MEGLHSRKKINREDETEFLDEEEQERLLGDLRQQNDQANLNIQRGLVVIGMIVSALFFSMLFQAYPQTIPISQLYQPTLTSAVTPRLVALLSIASIYLSIATLILSSSLAIVPGLVTQHRDTRVGWMALGTAICVIIQSMTSSWIEIVFWSIPSMLILMYYSAYCMIHKVSVGLDQLEKSRYKYKGA